MKLVFTEEEQLSINYLVNSLIKADGLILPEENVCWNTISIKMGWKEMETSQIEELSNKSIALSLLEKMSNDKKRFSIAFFKMIVLADQIIAPEEMELLEEIIRRAKLPEVTIAECATILDEYLY